MLAWLGATPKPPEGSSRAKSAAKVNRLSRRDRMKKDGIPIQMPPNPMPHIIARLIEIGITESNGMGATPLSWPTIDAWQRSVAIDLLPWEARLLRKLSEAYVAESRKAESENCPPPWRTAVTQREREIEEDVLRMVLG